MQQTGASPQPHHRALQTLAALVGAVAASESHMTPAQQQAGAVCKLVARLHPQGTHTQQPDAAWVAETVARLSASTSLTASPWRQSIHRYYQCSTGSQVRTSTSQADSGAITVSHVMQGKVMGPGVSTAAAARSSPVFSGPQHCTVLWAAPEGTDNTEALAACPGATVTAQVHTPVSAKDLQDRTDAVQLTTVHQTCVFVPAAPTPAGECAWSVQVTLAWAGASTTDACLALQQGAQPELSVTLCGTNIAKCAKARGVPHVVLDLVMKMSELIGANILDGSGALVPARLPRLVPGAAGAAAPVESAW